MKVSVGISNRHVHLKEEDAIILFGSSILDEKNRLNQPEQFSAFQTLKIKGPKGEIDNVRVIGPLRSYTQVEISKTDAYKLGLNPPVRKSGDLIGSSFITLIGPKGVLDLNEGCILPDRHIHITPKQLEMYGFRENQDVYVSVRGEKGCILKNVHFSVSEKSYFELHLDTDDANACLLKNGDIVDII